MELWKEGGVCFLLGLAMLRHLLPLIFLGRWLLNVNLAHYCSLAVLGRKRQ